MTAVIPCDFDHAITAITAQMATAWAARRTFDLIVVLDCDEFLEIGTPIFFGERVELRCHQQIVSVRTITLEQLRARFQRESS
jgi:hypothetical protein